jgi:outer membrane immunogenic protein
MKKLTFASVGLIAMAAALRTATAADADVYGPPPVIYPPVTVVLFSWTGFYFGGHVGGGWGSTNETGTPYGFFNGIRADTITPAPTTVDVSGWLGGGQIGANYQIGSFVFGVEADASGANLTGSSSCASTSLLNGALPPANCKVKVEGVGTIAGRLGVAFDRVLLYGKGGGAWASDKYSLTSPNANLLPTFNGSETKWGWMVGAGVEYAFYDNWSAKIEYNYMNLRTSNLQFTDVTGSFFLNSSIQQQLHVVKAGINYRWGWAPVGVRY